MHRCRRASTVTRGARLADPEMRKKIAAAIRHHQTTGRICIGLPVSRQILLVGFKSDTLSLDRQDARRSRKKPGRDPVDTIMNLVLEDRSRVDTVLHDVRGEHPQGDRSSVGVVGSDAASMARNHRSPSSAHSCAATARARRDVRDDKVLICRRDSKTQRPSRHEPRAGSPWVSEGRHVRRRRGLRSRRDRRSGDVRETAPVCRGVRHVFVNGSQVIKNGEHTGSKPGRALWGPGKVR